MSLKQKLQKIADDLGVILEQVQVGNTREVTATAPDGYCFEPELHQFVSNAYVHPGSWDFIREDMIERLTGIKIYPCKDRPKCDWCNPDWWEKA